MASSSYGLSDLQEDCARVSLQGEEIGGIDLGILDEGGIVPEFDPNLCLIGKFITDRPINASIMEQTLAAVWRPVMRMYVKELEPNLFLFMFNHVLDLERIVEKGPWSFEQNLLVTTRMEQGMNPSAVDLHYADFWVQVYDIPCGFMSELVGKEIGKFLGTFIAADSNNFSGLWRSYMRIRVRIDVSKPLKRRMRMKKPGGDWVWVNFKYERLPTFCFYCGLIGHSDQFCSALFKSGKTNVEKPYGLFMKAQNRRQTTKIGEKWLCHDPTQMGKAATPVNGDGFRAAQVLQNSSFGQRQSDMYGNQSEYSNKGMMANGENVNLTMVAMVKASDTEKEGVTDQAEMGDGLIVLDSKRRRQDRDSAEFMITGLEEASSEPTQNGSKNVLGAGAGFQARRDQ